MSWHFIVGPAGSGRTTHVVEVARDACRAGRRVWYVGLPAQRAYISRRVTHGGFTALGLEVMSAQQMYYRLLTGSGMVDIEPLVIGNGRLVGVAEALIEVGGALPTPGEARLFAAAIAEAKRFAVTPDDLAATLADDDAEGHRLVAVYRAYQRALQGSWDYDDVRLAAVALARGASGVGLGGAEPTPFAPGAEVIIVDGLREVGPLELEVLSALADRCDVYLTLPTAPTGVVPTTVLAQRPPRSLERFLAPNPVAEARWVMRSLKRDLAQEGIEALDLAIIAPSGRAPAIVALADEYGVPIMDETPIALADTPAGRVLLDLIELVEFPTASRLLAVPDLAELAAAALSLGVAGNEAIGSLAAELGLSRQWRTWTTRLNVHGDPVDWARDMLDLVNATTRPRPPAGFVAAALSMAQEAARLGSGPGFQQWWAALVRSARSGRRQRGGVALLDATHASGRRFRKAYLVGATEGAYGAREREDYFVPEEYRLAGAERRAALPPRLQGRDADVAAELLSRADHLVVTAPEADQSGPLVLDSALLGTAMQPLPELPAGSRLELPGSAPYVPEFDDLDLGDASAEFLREYARCAVRAWAGRALERDSTEQTPAWLALRDDLLSEPHLDSERLERLRARHPAAADWLAEHGQKLCSLTYSARFEHAPSGVTAIVEAGQRLRNGSGRGGGTYVIYLFVEPNPAADWQWARGQLQDRWNEYLAGAIALGHRSMAPAVVEFVVWPIYGAPIRFETSAKSYAKDRMAGVVRDVEVASRRFAAGDMTPSPGQACRDCTVFQVCRVRERA